MKVFFSAIAANFSDDLPALSLFPKWRLWWHVLKSCIQSFLRFPFLCLFLVKIFREKQNTNTLIKRVSFNVLDLKYWFAWVLSRDQPFAMQHELLHNRRVRALYSHKLGFVFSIYFTSCFTWVFFCIITLHHKENCIWIFTCRCF